MSKTKQKRVKNQSFFSGRGGGGIGIFWLTDSPPFPMKIMRSPSPKIPQNVPPGGAGRKTSVLPRCTRSLVSDVVRTVTMSYIVNFIVGL